MCIQQTPPHTQLVIQHYNRFTQCFQKILKTITTQQIEYTQQNKYPISFDLKQHLTSLGIHRNKRIKSTTPTARQLRQQTRLTRLRKYRKHKTKPITTHLPTLSWSNLRSLNNKIELIVGYLQDSDLDVHLFSETWICEQLDTIIINKLDYVKNYHIFSTPRSQQKTISEAQRSKQGGGLLTLIHKNFSPKQPTQIDLSPYISASSQQIPPEDQKLEVTIIRAFPKRLPSGFNCCLIINIYIPEFTETKQRKIIFQLKNLIEP